MEGLGFSAAFDRRSIILGLAGLLFLAPRQVNAQPSGRRPKVAILSPNPPAHARTPRTPLYGFLSGLSELGYVDQQNIYLEIRSADDALERLTGLALELVALRPDALYTWTSGGLGAAIAATSNIPIVVGPVNEAFVARHVQNFAHPGGNITGLTLNSRLQHQKCLQLLKEVAPQVSRVGVLLNPLNPAWDNYPAILNGAAQALGIELIRAEARSASELDRTFAVMREDGANGLFALDDSTLAGATPVPERLLNLIDEYRLPSASDAALFARQGGLLSLGRDYSAIGRSAARYVHRILQGDRAGDLPIQTPTEFTLIVNLRAAKRLGLDVRSSLLTRADEIIEEEPDLVLSKP